MIEQTVTRLMVSLQLQFQPLPRESITPQNFEEISTGEPAPTFFKRPAEGSRQKRQLSSRPSVSFNEHQLRQTAPIEVKEQAILFTPPPRASKRNLILWDNLDLSLNAPAPGICRQLDLISFC
ncbi:hypothetical protein ACLKA7_007610 [Drosophila subpalustris]